MVMMGDMTMMMVERAMLVMILMTVIQGSESRG